MKMATIYIVRHGETVGNSQRLLLHPSEGVLSEVGKEQTKLLAETLKNVRFTKVFISQYPRTKETASIILECNQNHFSQSEIIVDSRLREIDMEGIYGKPYSYLLKGLMEFIGSGQNLDEFRIDDSEPIPKLKERAIEFAKELFLDAFAMEEKQTILIVSHGTFIRMLMIGLHQSEEFETKGWDPSGENIIRNTGVMKLLVQDVDDKIQVDFEKFHDTSHLSQEMLETDALTKLTQTPEGKCLSGCFQVFLDEYLIELSEISKNTLTALLDRKL